MRRRDFISLLGGGLAAWPFAAEAQQTARVRKIAFLSGGSDNDPENIPRRAAFLQGLRELSWSEGNNFTYDHRYAGGEATRMSSLARELVESKPDVIGAATTAAVAAVRQHTSAIPIVFVAVTDPVESGLVSSLARPAGNTTGFMIYDASLGGKWLELLREVAPRLGRVAMMFNPITSPLSERYLSTFESVARSLAIEPIAARVRSNSEIEETIAALGHARAGLVVMSDVFTADRRKVIIEQAARHGVPAIYPFRFFARDGGLISYGVDLIDQNKRAAYYVHRILQGERPGDLPVQGPTRFELVINLNTVKAIGLTVPPLLIARTDEVIE